MTAIWIALLKNLGIPLLGAGFAYIKGSEWWDRRIGKKKAKALECIAAGVDLVWKTYYKEKKENLQAGTSLDFAKKNAMQMAKQTAIRFGASNGVDVLQEIGVDLLESFIEKEIRERKREGLHRIPMADWFKEKGDDK